MPQLLKYGFAIAKQFILRGKKPNYILVPTNPGKPQIFIPKQLVMERLKAKLNSYFLLIQENP